MIGIEFHSHLTSTFDVLVLGHWKIKISLILKDLKVFIIPLYDLSGAKYIDNLFIITSPNLFSSSFNYFNLIKFLIKLFCFLLNKARGFKYYS